MTNNLADFGNLGNQNNAEINDIKACITRLEEDFVRILKMNQENTDQILSFKPLEEDINQLRGKQLQIIEVLNTLAVKKKRDK